MDETPQVPDTQVKDYVVIDIEGDSVSEVEVHEGEGLPVVPVPDKLLDGNEIEFSFYYFKAG